YAVWTARVLAAVPCATDGHGSIECSEVDPSTFSYKPRVGSGSHLAPQAGQPCRERTRPLGPTPNLCVASTSVSFFSVWACHTLEHSHPLFKQRDRLCLLQSMLQDPVGYDFVRRFGLILIVVRADLTQSLYARHNESTIEQTRVVDRVLVCAARPLSRPSVKEILACYFQAE